MRYAMPTTTDRRSDSIAETKIGTALIIGIARAETDLEIMEEENIKLRMALQNHSHGLYH